MFLNHSWAPTGEQLWNGHYRRTHSLQLRTKVVREVYLLWQTLRRRCFCFEQQETRPAEEKEILLPRKSCFYFQLIKKMLTQIHHVSLFWKGLLFVLLEATPKGADGLRAQICGMLWDRFLGHIFGFFFPNIFVALKSQKMPNHINTWSHKIAGIGMHLANSQQRVTCPPGRDGFWTSQILERKLLPEDNKMNSKSHFHCRGQNTPWMPLIHSSYFVINLKATKPKVNLSGEMFQRYFQRVEYVFVIPNCFRVVEKCGC